MTQQFIIFCVVAFVVNVVFWIIGVRAFSKVYQAKFDNLVTIIHDAMAERDMHLRKMQGILAQAVVTDTKLFDFALMDEEKGTADGREEADTE